jgi:hypothetical protein
MSAIFAANAWVVEVFPSSEGITITFVPDDVAEPVACVDLPLSAAVALIEAVAAKIAIYLRGTEMGGGRT